MTKKNDELLVLVDGSSFLYRAFFAMPSLANSTGEPTGAIYGVINMLKRLMKDYPTDKLVVVFDPKGKTFRHDMYDEYKAQRPPMPPELRSQIPAIHDIIDALGLPKVVVDGVEADDVIGTLATLAHEKQMPTLIVTGDKDMAQLVRKDTRMYNSMSEELLDPAGVEQKFGVRPDQIIDYLTLLGDSSDNIPGVPKCGPKTAVKWLQEYGSLDEVIAHAGEMKGKIGENLRAHLEFFPLARQLTTIRCDVDIPCALDSLVCGIPDVEKLKTLYGQAEFKTWLEELLDGDAESAISLDFDVVTDLGVLENFITHAKNFELLAFDTETTSLDSISAELVGISCATPDLKAVYIPLAHDYIGAPQQLDRQKVLDLLQPLLSDPKRVVVGHNLKYDMMVLDKYGVSVIAPIYDTMLLSYLYNSVASRHNLDVLALKYLNYKTTHFEDIAGKGKKQLTFNQVDLAEAAPYAAEDAVVTMRLYQYLWPKLEEVPALIALYRELEAPLASVLAQVELTGVLIDPDLLRTQSVVLTARIDELDQEITALAGEAFNIASPKQLQAILYEKLKLPVLKKTPKGQPSTAEPVLQDLAAYFPLPKLILEYRSLAKLKQTYTDKLPLMIHEKTGRVHTSYHQAVTATGRLSSSDPNLQNIPIRTVEGRKIREAFIARPGYQIVAADYSQVELRIMAHLSQDSSLLAAFVHGEDVHRATAAEVFGVSVAEVSDDQRRSAKAINFGLIYGMSAFGLAKQLRVGRHDAQAYIERYFERYPGVKTYMDNIQASAQEQGFVETLRGRRLYLPDARASNKMRQQGALRTAINAPMQGTAADLIKQAMLDVAAWIAEDNVDALMIMQVHDELVFEVADSVVTEFSEKIKQIMSGVAQLDIPLIVDVGVGANWHEAH